MKLVSISKKSGDGWIGEVKTKWHPPEGFFEQSSTKIVSGLLKASKNAKQASERLHFYINRAGKNLKGEARERLEKAAELMAKKQGT